MRDPTGAPIQPSRRPPEIRARRILWAAFLAAVLVTVPVIVLVRGIGRSATPSAELLAILRPVLYGVGLIDFLLSFWLRRWGREPARALPDSSASGFPPAGPPHAGFPASELPHAGFPEQRASFSFAGQVIGWAMLASVSTMGLVLALLGGGLVDAFPLLLLSVCGFALQRPE